MDALDIISVEEAKDWLSTEDETHLPRLIKSAVEWVEQYTGYRLYIRPVTMKVDGHSTTVVGYPANVVSVTDKNGQPVSFCVVDSPSGTVVKYGYGASMITANVGYANKADVPSLLVDAAFKLLTYLSENRDLYSVGMPMDVQFMINKMRRNLV